MEEYLSDSSAALAEGSNSKEAPHPVCAAAEGECAANATLQAEDGMKDGDEGVIVINEEDLPRVQWHHPELYDTLVQVNMVYRTI